MFSVGRKLYCKPGGCLCGPCYGDQRAASFRTSAARACIAGVFRKKLTVKQMTDFSNIRTDEIKMTEVKLYSDYWTKIFSDSKQRETQHVQLRLFT